MSGALWDHHKRRLSGSVTAPPPQASVLYGLDKGGKGLVKLQLVLNHMVVKS